MAGVIAGYADAQTPCASLGPALLQSRRNRHKRAQSPELCGQEIAGIIDQARAYAERGRHSKGRRARMQRALSVLGDTNEGKHNLPYSTCGFRRRFGFQDPEQVAHCSTVCIAPSQREHLDWTSDEEAYNDEECPTFSL